MPQGTNGASGEAIPARVVGDVLLAAAAPHGAHGDDVEAGRRAGAGDLSAHVHPRRHVDAVQLEVLRRRRRWRWTRRRAAPGAAATARCATTGAAATAALSATSCGTAC